MPELREFFEELNENCLPLCSSDLRKKRTKEGFCSRTTAKSDNLEVRCVKPWAREKIHYLLRYFDLFSTGMQYKWGGNINYIEICSGPGVCIDCDSGIEFLGTPLAISQMKSFEALSSAVFIDINERVVSTLNQRFQNLGKHPKAIAIPGDYLMVDRMIQDIQPHISRKGLNLIFIDPTDLSVPFNTIRQLSSAFGSADIIINIMYGLDAKRGLPAAFNNPSGKAWNKYSSFLGSDDFLNDLSNQRLFEEGNHPQLHRNFIEYYYQKLIEIGYIYTGYQPVKNKYELFFATRNTKGMEFWVTATYKGLDGQRKLF